MDPVVALLWISIFNFMTAVVTAGMAGITLWYARRTEKNTNSIMAKALISAKDAGFGQGVASERGRSDGLPDR